ncbi:HK97 gp10 family phage protein [Butyrivibrio sp. FC2001]|uniref:HK97 gp10 family phage protein n=1 Tax=Butyrivibrio sp. FC2001 TaxID=1280671 RepID=UPI000428028A|nr:HK97 gp10 family phage protein [Butyrivibrio sp. FC2001]
MQKVQVNGLANAIAEDLKEYEKLATQEVKKDVKDTAKFVKKRIQDKAPVRADGKGKPGSYKKSWRTKTTKEDSTSIEVTVYSPSQYMLTHLLENGHAKVNGGRTRAFPHIKPAEAEGEKDIMARINRSLSQ